MHHSRGGGGGGGRRGGRGGGSFARPAGGMSSGYSSRGRPPPAVEDPTVKFKTKVCIYWLRPDGCPYGDKCLFAHGNHEIRQDITGTTPGDSPHTNARYKTRMCKHYINSIGTHCPHGVRCTYAHGPTELDMYTSIANGTATSQQLSVAAQGAAPGSGTLAAAAVTSATPALPSGGGGGGERSASSSRVVVSRSAMTISKSSVVVGVETTYAATAAGATKPIQSAADEAPASPPHDATPTPTSTSTPSDIVAGPTDTPSPIMKPTPSGATAVPSAWSSDPAELDKHLKRAAYDERRPGSGGSHSNDSSTITGGSSVDDFSTRIVGASSGSARPPVGSSDPLAIPDYTAAPLPTPAFDAPHSIDHRSRGGHHGYHHPSSHGYAAQVHLHGHGQARPRGHGHGPGHGHPHHGHPHRGHPHTHHHPHLYPLARGHPTAMDSPATPGLWGGVGAGGGGGGGSTLGGDADPMPLLTPAQLEFHFGQERHSREHQQAEYAGWIASSSAPPSSSSSLTSFAASSGFPSMSAGGPSLGLGGGELGAPPSTGHTPPTTWTTTSDARVGGAPIELRGDSASDPATSELSASFAGLNMLSAGASTWLPSGSITGSDAFAVPPLPTTDTPAPAGSAALVDSAAPAPIGAPAARSSAPGPPPRSESQRVPWMFSPSPGTSNPW